MSNLMFPQLSGIGWPVNRRPYVSTTVNKTAGGQEIRIPNWPYPLETFDLPINYLHDSVVQSPGFAADFEELYGFFVARLGPWDSFLYQDPTDNYTVTLAQYEGLSPTTGQNVIATGDGTTKSFQLFRTIGGALQPIYDINGITATLAPPLSAPYCNVYLNGVLQGSGFSVSNTGLLTFTSAPGNSVHVAADFSYFKRCVFADDSIDFTRNYQHIWKVKKLSIRQVWA